MARLKKNKPHVFCIGWHKTGTTTIGLALLDLGYSVVGARLDMAEPLLEGDLDTPLNLVLQFDALQDVPWAKLFKELDRKYPNSKFILTIRDEEEWLHSAKKHFGSTYVALHEWLYGEGVLVGNEGLYLEKYKSHNREVLDYFSSRKKDLLVLDFSKGDRWDKICHFLNEPIPKKQFPHENKGKHSRNWKDNLKMFLRSIIPTKIRKRRVKLLEKKGLHYGENRFNNAKENKKYIQNERIKRERK